MLLKYTTLHWWTPLGLRCITRSRVLISVSPMFCKYLFTVDADTIAEAYSLNHLILHESCLIDSGWCWVCCSIHHDKRCFGALHLCMLTHKSPFSYPTRSFSTIPTTTLTPSIWRTCYIELVKIGTLLFWSISWCTKHNLSRLPCRDSCSGWLEDSPFTMLLVDQFDNPHPWQHYVPGSTLQFLWFLHVVYCHGGSCVDTHWACHCCICMVTHSPKNLTI